MQAQVVNVAVRIKPGQDVPAVFPSEVGVVIKERDASLSVLDGFGSIVGGSDQQDAYDAIAAPLVDRLLEGYSCTLMAYGQTGSGKTHTIFGPPGVLTEAALRDAGGGGTPADWGLFPRIALELLESGRGTLHASAVEVYQERAYDLLADRQQLSVGAQKTGRSVAGAKPDKDPNAAVPHKSTCSCRVCYLAKEEEKKARAAGLSKPRPKAAPQSFSELSRGRAPLSGRTNVAGRPTAGKGAGADVASTADESFATVGEKRMLITEPADIARLARTIEHTRTAVGHLLNARSSRSHCLGESRNAQARPRLDLELPHAHCQPPATRPLLARSISLSLTHTHALAPDSLSRSLFSCLPAVHLHLTEVDGDVVTKRQLLVVDLAGSERILRSGAEGLAAAQAMAINTSLTALGKVVRAVGAKATHVPYRDSTLTQLLRSSLSGRACTSVVIAVASEACHTDESKCSLEFGQRMQAVRTKAAVVVGDKTAEDEEYDTERQLEAAKRQLSEFEASGYGERFGPAAQPGEKRAFQENTSRLAAYEREIRHTRAEIAEIDPGLKAEARELTSTLREMQAEMLNLQGMIKRQKLISGFYIPARAVYTRKLAEVYALENKLETLKEVRESPHGSTSNAAVSAPPPSTGKWASYVNDDNGHTYYHNEATGESTYTRPAGFSSPKTSPVKLF